MPSLSVRKLDKSAYEQLRIRAAKHGVSMEEEVRNILSQAVSVPDRLSDVFQRNFGSKMGINLETLSHIKTHDPLDIEE